MSDSTKVRIAEGVLWTLAVAAVLVATAESRRALRGEATPAPVIWPAPPPNGTVSSDSLAVLATRIVEADVFRVDRKPATMPYRVVGDSGTSPPPATPVPKPLLTLVGIVGGPPWAALLDGVPSHEGTVLVHVRDTVGGLRIREVTSTYVTVTGLDTAWHLTSQHD